MGYFYGLQTRTLLEGVYVLPARLLLTPKLMLLSMSSVNTSHRHQGVSQYNPNIQEKELGKIQNDVECTVTCI